tara:strand:- start:3026 stop:3250 length:225 start_codon:yes stop_codon:yes gene_type:complete
MLPDPWFQAPAPLKTGLLCAFSQICARFEQFVRVFFGPKCHFVQGYVPDSITKSPKSVRENSVCARFEMGCFKI